MIPVKDILITPEHFFSELCKKEENFKTPLLIIALISLTGGIAAFITSAKMVSMMPVGMEGLNIIISAIGFIAAVIGTFIVWLIWTVAFYIMSSLYKGTASFKRLAEVTAYGFIPQIFGSIIGLIVMYTSLPDLVLPATSDMQEIQNAMEAFTTSPVMMTAMFIGIIFTLWSANIWIFGVKEASKLEFKKAALCVIIPLIIYVLFTTSSLFM